MGATGIDSQSALRYEVEVDTYIATFRGLRHLPNESHFNPVVQSGRYRHLADVGVLHRNTSGRTRPHAVIEARCEDDGEVDQPPEDARILHFDVNQRESHRDVGVVFLRAPEESDSGFVSGLREHQASNSQSELNQIAVAYLSLVDFHGDLQFTRTGKIRVDTGSALVERAANLHL